MTRSHNNKTCQGTRRKEVGRIYSVIICVTLSVTLYAVVTEELWNSHLGRGGV
jgi:hypothetical protein